MAEGLDSSFDGSSFGGFNGVSNLPAKVDSHVHRPSDGRDFSRSQPVHKRKIKPVHKVDLPLLVVGEDITLNQIVLTNELTLVGRFGGCRVSHTPIL